jgi:ElaB/YqjD/DUF883 family membrane-anchored ribosome-binding protein
METHFPTMHESMGIHPTDKVVEDLNALVRDAEELLKVTADQPGEQAEAARARLAATIESAKKTSLRLKETTLATARAADRIIRANPYQSVSLALGAGLVIGVLLGRR